MKSALVTGANKGIGFEVAKILAQKGFFVYLGSRTIENGLSAVEKLRAKGLNNIAAVQLDVSSQTSVDAARREIGEKTDVLDVLVNNAGIAGGFEQSALTSSADQYLSVFDTNLFGVVRTTQAFIDLLRKSSEPRIVNVSTAMASLSMAADIQNSNYPKRYVIYQSSKAALNMYTVQLAYELRDTAFKVNAVCPGWTQTDFTMQQGTNTPEQAGERIAKYALIGADGPTAQYISEEYFPEPATCPW
ncbi:SDR family oxidoreductase [Chitinophaga pinensis]|uniref:Short-chain dehydrogenase/reductase SDR n=1 Tax=Chitinophaga pinensis (strain ATCC 43595 / DSM 2588 / LMG 13176 / NBRC 15968 / NCIMB 11800 / UQM 2034) TaxID=485918 RepID=A0A979GWM6_CHIPD|nr:SDR family oxidoreductase [Chitinophaga pinensis]ACU62059.1 short-chain dehydrogenase/reductase SDR [Chitinophaga pinensis DSM 2588]